MSDFSPGWPALFVIPADKLTKYLLNTNGAKPDHARWFIAQGFSPEKPDELADALYLHANERNISTLIEDEFGWRFVFEARLITPRGSRTLVRSVWMFHHTEKSGAARFVTAYPIGPVGPGTGR